MRHRSLVHSLLVPLVLAFVPPSLRAQTTFLTLDRTRTAPAISGDGQIIVAADGDPTGPYAHVFDRLLGTWAPTWVRLGGFPSISADGRYMAYEGGYDDKCYVWDRQTGVATVQSVPYSEDLVLDGPSHHCEISADGRFLAFASDATTLVQGDTNGVGDVFVRDLERGVTTRASVGPGGVEANAGSVSRNDCLYGVHCVTISADGAYVAFSSDADNLVAGDTNAATDVFVHDRRTATTTRASVASGGGEANGRSTQGSISADGRHVAFRSNASNLVPNDGPSPDIFIHDRQTSATVLISLKSDGTPNQHYVENPVLSADGRFVVFEADSQLDPADLNLQEWDVYMRDVREGRTFVVSAGHDQLGRPILPGPRQDPVVSADGRYVVYNVYRAGLYLFDRLSVPVDANAGEDLSADELATVTLNGSASTGTPPLSYLWEQVSGTSVALAGADTATATFTAPTVGTGGETLSFRLTVTSADLTTDSDLVNVNVLNVNRPPFADAGNAQTVSEGSVVALDGTGSYDPDGDSLSYSWRQTAGPGVDLGGSDTAKPGFLAPAVDAGGETLTFELMVSDGLATAAGLVTVIVVNENVAPVADAGHDLAAAEGTRVTLDGSASHDPDGEPITFAWTQVSGPTVMLDATDQSRPAFTAPDVDAGGAQLVFGLHVSDGQAVSVEDTVAVAVINIYDPPSCAAARGGEIWPPNHALVPVSIAGVADADPANQLQIVVDEVTQDEPHDGLGDGDTSPDVVLVDGQLHLRAERAGAGNGRVYHVLFTAYGAHGSCSGVVFFAVPHNKKTAAIDDGPLYSTPIR